MLTLAPMAPAHAATASRGFVAPRRALRADRVAAPAARPSCVPRKPIIIAAMRRDDRFGGCCVRATRRPALVTTRALSDGDADKWELAQAIMRMRRTQDEALDLILSEVSTLSKEVRSLRRELDELRANGSVAPSTEKTVAEVAKNTQDRDVLNEMLNALIPESDGSGDEGDAPRRSADVAVEESSRPAKDVPFPENADIADVPVVLDVAGWKGDGTDRSHLWPMCKMGEDDLYLMSTIQSSLNEAGFWAGEEDEADMYFGPSTQEAMCYFQASVGLPEVGYVDPDTWRALLGDDRYAWGPVPGAIGFDAEEALATEEALANAQAPAEAAPTADAKAATEWSKGVVSLVDNPDNDPGDDAPVWGDEQNRPIDKVSEEFTQIATSGEKWPVLRLEDGGMEVHKLHVLLDSAGYYSGEEDMEWWSFGGSTENALGTFQASNGLPDTGLTCLLTWKALLGEERVAMGPAKAFETVGELASGEYTMDLSRQDRVFLLGEGRFEGTKK